MAWFWFFDLDGTLYDAQSGLWPAIKERITLFVQQHLNLTRRAAEALRQQWVAQYGTTLRGLQHADPALDARAYFAFVHDLPLEDYIHPDPRLAAVLAALPGRKWVLTNADAAHAQRVLQRLGVREHFVGVIDLFALGEIPKPLPEAYRRALALAGSPPPAQCVLVDDQPRNVAAAQALGMRTVWIAPMAAPDGPGDAHVTEIYQLPAVWQRWAQEGQGGKDA